MKITGLIVLGFLCMLCGTTTMEAQWRCAYATYDDASNGTGHNTPNIAVIGEDNFVATVWSPSSSDPRGARNYFIPYALADSANGRLVVTGYGSTPTAGIYNVWDGGFDQVGFSGLYSIRATPDGVIYGANNDVNHNLLVFKFESGTVAAQSPYYRQETGTTSLSAVDIDGSGYVYVLNDTSNSVADDIKIYPPIAQWSSHQDAPMQTVDLPDGIYKGIAVTPDGSAIFISDYGNRMIHKYVGSPGTGYSIDLTFTFAMAEGDTVNGRGEDKPAPLNLAFKSPENILFAAIDFWLLQEYSWGRIYLIDPGTGALASADSSVSIIDVAQWNFDMTGVYNNRPGPGTFGTASGYTSTFDVEFDGNGNLYSQSHYGWTVEKWTYDGILPTLSVTSVEPISNTAPDGYGLSGNYPNPFNPATTLEFSVAATTPVVLDVFDALGRKIATLADGVYESGVYKVRFTATDLPSGLYYARLNAGQYSFTQKMLLTK